MHRISSYCALLLAVFAPYFQAQPALTIHDYADAAACQMGAREANYLPSGITPGGSRIKMFWQGMELIWDPTNTTTGAGEFKVIDPVNGKQPIGMNYPQNLAGGPFTNPLQSNSSNPTGSNVRCDHFSYVDPSCTPDQFIREVFQGSCAAGPNKGAICSADSQCPTSSCTGMVRWHVLFRRQAAAAKTIDNNPATPKPTDWEVTLPNGKTTSTYMQYYDIVDAIGLKLDTYGAVWLDGLGGPSGHTAARDFTNGFRKGPMPRPGGKRPDLRAEGMRATKWFDTPAEMATGTCNACHGTPFNGSDWIKQATPTLKFKNDEDLPWWHAGNDSGVFPDKTFFIAAHNTDSGADLRCGTCHKRWMIRSGTTPGGEFNPGVAFARFMTMVHDNNVNNPFRMFGDPAYQQLASSFRTDAPQAVYLQKNAEQTHWMPPDHGLMTVKDWIDTWSQDYNSLACCASGVSSGIAGAMLPPTPQEGAPVMCAKIMCTGMVSQSDVKPSFITPWMQANGAMPMANAKADGRTQFIDSPDPAANVSLTFANCPAGLTPTNPGDRCFRLSWSDPSGSPFNAPKTFHYKQLPNKNVTDPNWTDADIKSTQYCGDGAPTELVSDPSAVFPKTKSAGPLPVTAGDAWRFNYETYGILPKCQKMALRLCGGWCPEAIQLTIEAAPRTRLATDLGQLVTLANDSETDVSSQLQVTRSGFRKNLTTGNFIQTITLMNNSSTAIPGPITLMLNNLRGATLVNKSGGTDASPYVSINVGDTLQLGPGQSVSATLEFLDPTNQAITYTTQELAFSISAACQPCTGSVCGK